MRRRLLLLPLLGVAGCGSVKADELPPAATPAASPPLTATPAGRVDPAPTPGRDGPVDLDLPTAAPDTAKAQDGATTLRLDHRARRLQALGATTGTVGAGFGPTGVASDGKDLAYVTDTTADGVVVVRLRPTLAVTRRVGLPGAAPWGIAYDAARGRLWVTLTATNELAELAAGSRPRELRRYPTVRAPRTVEVLEDGRIAVLSRTQVQLLRPAG